VNEATVWDSGVVVSPLEKVNLKQEIDEVDKNEGDEEEDESNSMDTEN